MQAQKYMNNHISNTDPKPCQYCTCVLFSGCWHSAEAAPTCTEKQNCSYLRPKFYKCWMPKCFYYNAAHAAKGYKNKLRMVDLFCGIGGFHLGMRSIAEIFYASDIDKHARATYKQNCVIMPDGDITKIKAEDIPAHDLLTAGIPCQPFSFAGKRLGFADTRGTLFDQVLRIAKHHMPRFVLIENVKGLVSHDKGKTLATMRQEFKSIGYESKCKVLNAKDFGVPQNRERLFILFCKDEQDLQAFRWPEPISKPTKIADILEVPTPTSNVVYTLSDVREGANVIHSWDMLRTTERQKTICLTLLRNRRKSNYGNKDGNALHFHQLQELIPDLQEQELLDLQRMQIIKTKPTGAYDFVYSKNSMGIHRMYRIVGDQSIFPSLIATKQNDYVGSLTLHDNLWKYLQEHKARHAAKGNGFGYRLNTPEDAYTNTLSARYYKDGSEILLAQDYSNPRRLSVRECARLQGFPDWFQFPVSQTQAYKQLGNAVCVKVIEAIAEQLQKCIAR